MMEGKTLIMKVGKLIWSRNGKARYIVPYPLETSSYILLTDPV